MSNSHSMRESKSVQKRVIFRGKTREQREVGMKATVNVTYEVIADVSL